jgi:hypothetical protein
MYQKTVVLLEKKISQHTTTHGNDGVTDLYWARLYLAQCQSSWGYYLFHETSAQSECATHKQLATGIYKQLVLELDSDSTMSEHRSLFLGSVHFSFAKHCQELFELGANSELGDIALQQYFRGLQQGDYSCRNRVIPVLKLIYALSTRNKKVNYELMLQSALNSISAWVFLKFSSQLMGCLDLPEGKYAAIILSHIGKHYVNALYYPFNISYSCLGSIGQSLCGPLKALLTNPTIDAFVEALTGLTHPELRWYYQLFYSNFLHYYPMLLTNEHEPIHCHFTFVFIFSSLFTKNKTIKNLTFFIIQV